jgi:hypothetical protein
MIESFRLWGNRIHEAASAVGLSPVSAWALVQLDPDAPALAEGARQPAALQTLYRRRSHRPLVQSLLRIPYHLNSRGPVRAMSGLHVLNAIFIFWIA